MNKPDMKQLLSYKLTGTNKTVAEAAIELGIEEEQAWIIIENIDLFDCSVCGKWVLTNTVVDDECVDCRH